PGRHGRGRGVAAPRSQRPHLAPGRAPLVRRARAAGRSVNARAQDERAALLRTLEDLAAFGEKRAGTDAGRAAGDYVGERMRQAGLERVHCDPFRFPQHRVVRAELVARAGGELVPAAFEALEGCAAGRLTGPLIFAGWADQAEALRKQDWRSRIALVERNP